MFVSLQSAFLPLSTLRFPVAWWHSGLLLFVVSFNPPIGSCSFLRTSTFLTRKLSGGDMGEGKHYNPKSYPPVTLKWELTHGRYMILQEIWKALLIAMLKLSLLGSWVNPLRRMGWLPLLSFYFLFFTGSSQHAFHFGWLCSHGREKGNISSRVSSRIKCVSTASEKDCYGQCPGSVSAPIKHRSSNVLHKESLWLSRIVKPCFCC